MLLKEPGTGQQDMVEDCWIRVRLEFGTWLYWPWTNQPTIWTAFSPLWNRVTSTSRRIQDKDSVSGKDGQQRKRRPLVCQYIVPAPLIWSVAVDSRDIGNWASKVLFHLMILWFWWHAPRYEYFLFHLSLKRSLGALFAVLTSPINLKQIGILPEGKWNKMKCCNALNLSLDCPKIQQQF